jgi:adenylate cyclase
MSLFAELKRRNVIRMAGLYLVGAWLVVQVAGTLLPMFGAPDWIGRSVVILLAIGFVPVLVFSWIFELTPQGLKRDEDAAPGQALAAPAARRIDRVIIALLVLALGYFVVDKFMVAPPSNVAPTAASGGMLAERSARREAAVDSRSIAVLPFANMSADKENEFFSDGLSEEILNSLARIDGMQVVGRTSSFQFKGRNEDLRVIGERLGVANVLEGSVRREGNKARITAQLISAATGTHLWSETYDRTLDDTLAVQLDIAEKVAGVLDVVLDDGQRTLMAQDGVRNVEAFIAYQKGLKLYDQAHDPEHSRNAIEGLRLANVEFERAATLEPGFAQAYFMAADLYDHILLADGRPHAERLDAQRQAMRLYGLVAEHSHDAQQRLLALVERQMVSDDWTGLGEQIEAALKQPGCRNPDWLPVFASAFGYTGLIEDLGRRTSACDPLNRINFNSRARAALAAGSGQKALDILAEYERTRGGVPVHSAVRVGALLMLGNPDAAKAELAAIDVQDESYYKAEAWVAAASGENPARLHARLQSIDRSRSIYDFWDDADAVETALSGNRSEANRHAAALDARPAGPFLLAVLATNCLCGAPFDLDATPNFRARLAESGLRWPPSARIGAAPRTLDPNP